MTTSTPNLALVLYNNTTDSAEYFSNFRATIAGVSLSSNFYKIDTAYGTMQSEIDSIQAGAYLSLANFVSANYYESTVTGISAYNTGMKIILSLDTASAGTVTLNINSLGIKSVMKIDSTGTPVNISSGELMVDKYYLFAYDGTRWVWVNSTSADQIYVPGTSGNILTVNTDNTIVSGSALADNTTNNATTSTHGLILKATAPASGVRNVVAIDNGETNYKNTALVDTTNPSDILATVSPGTSLVAARRDHVHVRKTTIITSTRAMNVSSGNVSYTGVGFKPIKITAQANIPSTFSASIGTCNATQMQVQYTHSNSSYNALQSSYVVFIYGATGGVDYQIASIVSMDNDGFTLAWTKGGTDTATISMSFLCET